MDSIKKFFEKKKSDTKFKLAGQGKSLSSSSSSSMHSRSKGGHKMVPSAARAPSSSGAKMAGAAALARMEKSGKQMEVDWSMQAIRAQARRELEAEREKERLAEEAEADPNSNIELSVEASPMLAVQGVSFYCPLIGCEVGSYNEVKRQIRDFLYSQLGEDKAIASCLIIHTCNKNKEKVRVCIETLCKYTENIVSNLSEEKYRKIRQSNKAYQERVACVEGSRQFLEAAGFQEQQLPFNETTDTFWVFPGHLCQDVTPLQSLCDALVSAEPLRPQLHRSTRVLLPKEASENTDLPPEFFNLTVDELKKEMQLRADAIEQSQVLMTKAMRERQDLKEAKKYRFTLVRVRLPDGLVLQGTFGVHEKFEAVMTFVREHLINDWRPFFLSLSGGGKQVNEEEQSLFELRLVPAVVFNFEWDSSVSDPNLDDSLTLKEDSLKLLSNDAL